MSETVDLNTAIAMLPEGEQVHTFRQGGPVLIGAGWDRGLLIDAMAKAKEILLCGPAASRMNHGLCINDGHGRLFIETRNDCLKAGDGEIIGPPLAMSVKTATQGGYMTAIYPDPCEYNPVAKRAADVGECHAPAEVVVGARGQWRLCKACAALPEFKRFRVRRDMHHEEG